MKTQEALPPSSPVCPPPISTPEGVPGTSMPSSPSPPVVKFTDRWGNTYDKCPVCGRAHRDVRSLAMCQVRRHARWMECKANDGLREVGEDAMSARAEADLRRELVLKT